ncbi:hypothetical protein MNB_SUP05-SYMBIONT-4-1210 [hydrothermal vent metagenome]|uniref:Uncharacterized protein n=1 Tax=hydrothermal vent metagenome TaxID=652676 RepID=A0A1W1E059_9ZZZZ
MIRKMTDFNKFKKPARAFDMTNFLKSILKQKFIFLLNTLGY